MKPWYYIYDGVNFIGFTQEPKKWSVNANGPFGTLKEAEKDALDFLIFTFVWVDKLKKKLETRLKTKQVN